MDTKEGIRRMQKARKFLHHSYNHILKLEDPKGIPMLEDIEQRFVDDFKLFKKYIRRYRRFFNFTGKEGLKGDC